MPAFALPSKVSCIWYARMKRDLPETTEAAAGSQPVHRKKKKRKKKNRDKERKNYLLFIICFSILPSRFRCWRDSLPFVAFRRNSFHRSPCIERHRFTYTWARKKKTCSLCLLSGARYIEIRVPGLYRLPSCTVERLLGLSSARQIAACR